MGSGPEFGREFRFGLRFRVRVPSSVLSSGSEFGSGSGRGAEFRFGLQVRGSVGSLWVGRELGVEFGFGFGSWA